MSSNSRAQRFSEDRFPFPSNPSNKQQQQPLREAEIDAVVDFSVRNLKHILDNWQRNLDHAVQQSRNEQLNGLFAMAPIVPLLDPHHHHHHHFYQQQKMVLKQQDLAFPLGNNIRLLHPDDAEVHVPLDHDGEARVAALVQAVMDKVKEHARRVDARESAQFLSIDLADFNLSLPEKKAAIQALEGNYEIMNLFSSPSPPLLEHPALPSEVSRPVESSFSFVRRVLQRRQDSPPQPRFRAASSLRKSPKPSAKPL